jgi:uncharacterized membrane protein
MKERRTLGSWIVISLLLTSGVLHLVTPEAFLWLMPPFLPFPLFLVYVSGVAELLGGLGLLYRARFAPYFCVLVLLGVWPANWWFAIDVLGQADVWLAVLAWARLPLQVPLMWWAWRSPKRPASTLSED